MKKSCFLLLTIWTVLLIIIAGRTIVLYFQHPLTLAVIPPLSLAPPSFSNSSNIKISTNGSIGSLAILNPLFKYCNLPDRSSFFGLEGHFEKDFELLGVIVLFRHGDRGPLISINNDRKEVNCSSFVTDHYHHLEEVVKTLKNANWQQKLLPKSDFCKPGLLSKQGASQLVELGIGLQEAYKNQFNFSVPNVTSHIVAKTTPYSRTIQSLYSMLFGLVGPNSFLNVSPLSNSDVPFCSKHCRCEAASRYEKQHKKELNDRMKDIDHRLGNFSAQMRMVLMGMGNGAKDVLLPSTIKDVMLYYTCHNQTPPCDRNNVCLNFDAMGRLDQLLHYEADASASGLNLKKASILRAYGLINSIDQQIQSWISLYKKRHSLKKGPNPPRFLFYSGHDLTLMYLLSSLSIYNGFLPHYASRFTVEVLAKNGQHYARLLWNGDDVTRQSCTSTAHLPYCNARFLPKLFRNEMRRHFQTDKFWEACEV